jgi:di/tricarboxylate transporter
MTINTMPATTRLVGLLLIALGVIGYVATGRASVTALIPAFFGAIFLVLALVARGESARKHAMHAAVALALVGLLGTIPRILPALSAGDLARPAVLAQIVMAVTLAIYVGLGVKSFIDARARR